METKKEKKREQMECDLAEGLIALSSEGSGSASIAQAEQLLDSSSDESNITVVPNAAERKDSTQKSKLTGAARKRLHNLLKQGLDFEKARELALKPYSEIKKTIHVDKIRSTKTKGLKRVRSTETSTTPENPNKRPKTHNTGSYSQILGSIKVAIMDEDLSLTTEKMQNIQDRIMDEVDKLPPTQGPRFLSCTFKPSWLVINCANQHTHDWLAATIPGLKPWPEAKLKLVEGENIPKPKVGVVWIPGIQTTEKILGRLSTQNTGLNTDKWRVLQRKDDTKGQTLTVSIDEESYNSLKKQNNKAFLNFGMVTFRIKEGSDRDKGRECQTTEKGREVLKSTLPSTSKDPVREITAPSTSTGQQMAGEPTTPKAAASRLVTPSKPKTKAKFVFKKGKNKVSHNG